MPERSKKFTQALSEPDGLVTTLSVMDGIGQRPNFQNRTSYLMKPSLYLGVSLFLSSPLFFLMSFSPSVEVDICRLLCFCVSRSVARMFLVSGLDL